MSKGGKVEFDVRSMRHGASVAGQIGRAFQDSADRVAGLPNPEGTPPDIAGVLRSVSSSLHLASRSSSSQRSWLRFHAELALLADGPMAILLALLSPPLLAPFSFPKLKLTPLKKPPRNLPGPDWLWHGLGAGGKAVYHFGDGVATGAYNFGDGLVRTADLAAIAMTPGLYELQKQFKGVPILGLGYKMNQESLAGLDYARKHPGDFLKLMGKDTIDYNDYKNGDTSKALGRNTFDIASWLLPVGKLGKAASLAKEADEAAAASKAAAAEAKVAQRSAQNSANSISGKVKNIKQRPGESDDAFLDRQRDYKQNLTDAKDRLKDVKATTEQVNQNLATAQAHADEAHEKASELLKDMPKEAAKEAAKDTNTAAQGVNKELANERREEQEKAEHEHSAHHASH